MSIKFYMLKDLLNKTIDLNYSPFCNCCRSRFCISNGTFRRNRKPKSRADFKQVEKHEKQWKDAIKKNICPQCGKMDDKTIFWNRGWNYGIECINCR